MSRRKENLRDLVEEAKRRSVLLFTCVLGLAYLMSLTSSSVWMNVPAALILIVVVRCLSHELEAKRKQAHVFKKPSKIDYSQYQQLSPSDPLLQSPPSITGWKKKVDSPLVEAALDSFTQHIVREWLTDLWYSSITPDKDAPQELQELINDIFGEIAKRVKHVNLLDLLTRDMVDLIRSHLELYRKAQSHASSDVLSMLSFEERDAKLKLILISFKELHPALISSEAECKVLERLMGGVLAIILRPEYLECKFVRFLSRELLACAVMRPIMNFASPRFINELVVKSSKKNDKSVGATPSENKGTKVPMPLQGTSDAQDRSQSGVELVQLGRSVIKSSASTSGVEKLKESQPGYRIKSSPRSSSPRPRKKLCNMDGEMGDALMHGKEKCALVSNVMEHSESASSNNGVREDRVLEESIKIDKHSDQNLSCATRQIGADDWGQMLEVLSKRKTQALAPEHLDNMWTKGRYYKKKEGASSLVKVAQNPLFRSHGHKDSSKYLHSGEHAIRETEPQDTNQLKDKGIQIFNGKHDTLAHQSVVCEQVDYSHDRNNCDTSMAASEEVVDNESHSMSEDDESSGAEGLGTPGVKVWESISNRNASAASKVRHPLEIYETPQRSRRNKTHVRLRKPVRVVSDRQHSRSSGSGIPTWQELQRTSFPQGDGLDILKNVGEKCLEPQQDGLDILKDVGEKRLEPRGDGLNILKNVGERRLEPAALVLEETGSVNEIHAPSSTACWTSNMSSSSSIVQEAANSNVSLSSQKLQCRVLGADFVRNGAKILAVYSVLVIDSQDHTWFVKRRFRHFEELHRRLKEYPEYPVNLPPKHFLCSSLDTSLVLRRCFQLDKYLQDLLSAPGIAESVEVWDFLSVDSQTYGFPNSLSLIKTLTVNLDDEQDEASSQASEFIEDNQGLSGSRRQNYADSSRSNDNAASFVRHSATKLPVSFQKFSSNDRLESKGTAPFPTVGDKNIQEQGGSALQGQGNFSDTDSETEGQKLGSWARELEVSGDHEIKAKMKYLEEAVTSLSRGCLSGSSSAFINSGEEDDLAVSLEWIPPKLSVPLLNLVDVIFELEARGWIRRQVFWIAKQVLQLGMGDAFDDWMLAKIQYLRRGEVIASAIRWLEQVLWPNGVFITKLRRAQSLESAKVSKSMQDPHIVTTIDSNNSVGIQRQISCEQALNSCESAKMVHELIVENAPTALVSLIGRKQYQQCAEDVYSFLQSTVFVKQLAYSLLEVLLLAIFPELHDVVLDIQGMIV